MADRVKFPAYLIAKVTDAQMAKLAYAVALKNAQVPPDAPKRKNVTKAEVIRALLDTLPDPPAST